MSPYLYITQKGNVDHFALERYQSNWFESVELVASKLVLESKAR